MLLPIIEKFQDAVNRFEKYVDNEEMNPLCTDLMVMLETLSNCNQIKDDGMLRIIHTTGIHLWNQVVTKKSGKLINQSNSAKARHVALHLIYMATFSDSSQTTSRKQLAMALKAGKDWLDCNDSTMAEKCFMLATECYMKLLRLIESKETTLQLTSNQMNECHNNMIRVYTFQAEMALSQSKHAIALECFNKAKNLPKADEQVKLLRGISYNFGLDCYQKELYSYSAQWLRASIEFGSGLDDEQKATTNQLLAAVYFELNGDENLQKAKDYIESSLQTQFHMKSILLKIKIMVELKQNDDDILKVMVNVCDNTLLDVKIALQPISLLVEKQRYEVCFQFLELLNNRFPRFAENMKIQMKRLECLLSQKKTVEAKKIIESELFRVNNSTNILDDNSMKQLQLLLWEQAQASFEMKDHLAALQWYNYSLKFMTLRKDDTVNFSKLQRNRCLCFIEMKNFEEALEAALEAEKYSPDSPHVYFLLLKIYLLTHNNEKVARVIDKLSEFGLETNDDLIHGLLCISAQLAFEVGNRTVSETLLEKIIVHVKETKQMLVSLRCLTRLKFTYLTASSKQSDIENVLKLIQKAYQILCTVEKHENKDEIIWFNKIAWNLALSCNEFQLKMMESFMLCYKLSLLLPTEEINLSQQKSCLLMAVGSGLHVSRTEKIEEKKKDMLKQVVEIIEKCYSVYSTLSENPDFDDPMKSYLLCYEFEVKAHLHPTDLDDIFEKAMQLRTAHAKLYENFASVALTVPSATDYGIKALKLSIKSHLEQSKVDFPTLSKVVHSLVHISLQKGNLTHAESKEEAYDVYQDILKIVNTFDKGSYPQMELIWLMTKAWNCGIHLYSAHHHEAAEKWCTVSMKFLKYIGDLRSNYEPHMTAVYTDIVSRIQQFQAHTQVEE